MPRPKRTKLALSTSATPMRVADPKQKKSRQLELSTTSSDRVQNNSDDSEGLVTTRKIKPNQRRGVQIQEAMMSGALGIGDPAPARARLLGGKKTHMRSKTERNADHDKAIEALKARRDAELAAKGGNLAIESTLTGNSPVRGRAALRVEEENPPADVVTTTTVQATPHIAPSIFEVSNFKRRPRQPSLLRLIQAQGNHQSEDDKDDEDDDLDNFQPDDASTPFPKSKSHSGLYSSPSPPPVRSAQTSSSKKRKRASPEVHVPNSQPIETVLASSPLQSLTPDLEPEEKEESQVIPSSSPNSEPEPSLPVLRHQPTNSLPPTLDSDTLAPPLSSSPAPCTPPNRAKSRPIRGNAPFSPSPPLSPQPAASRALKPLSTASLQNLLPRRRLHLSPFQHGDLFDLPSSDLEIDTAGLEEDEDELVVHAKVHVKGRNRDRRPEPGARKTGKGSKKQPQQKRKEREKENATGRKTYVRNKAPAAANDENDENENPEDEEDDDDDDNGNEADDSRLALAAARAKARGAKTGTATTSELKRLAIKFREVDEWKLEIEDMTGSGSSQKDAR